MYKSLPLVQATQVTEPQLPVNYQNRLHTIDSDEEYDSSEEEEEQPVIEVSTSTATFFTPTEAKVVEKTMKSNIVDITLGLMVNKTQYNKYLEKKHPEKVREKQNMEEKMEKYQEQIVDIFHHLLHIKPQFLPTSTKYSHQLMELHEQFVKECIHHIELQQEKEVKISNKDKYENAFANNDEDILFGEVEKEPIESSSVWGNKIKRTIFTNDPLLHYVPRTNKTYH